MCVVHWRIGSCNAATEDCFDNGQDVNHRAFCWRGGLPHRVHLQWGPMYRKGLHVRELDVFLGVHRHNGSVLP